MSMLHKLRAELIDIIEWVDDSRHTLVWRFPRHQNQIKYGAQLIVRPGQSAVFVRQGEIADVFSTSNGLGWEQGIMDLVLFLETGQLVKRHYDGCRGSSMGLLFVETDSGIEVRQVKPDCFAAEVGLEPGDRLVRMGGAAVYSRSDLWLLNDLLEAGSELEVEFVRGRELRSGRGRLSPVDARLVGE